MVDTGTAISVLPLTSKSSDLRTSAIQLYAANSFPIKVIKEKGIKLDLGLRSDFQWLFIGADIASPIIGADFLWHYDLLIDITIVT